MQYDLILRNGRVLDPNTGHDGVADIAFASGKVAALGTLDGTADPRDIASAQRSIFRCGCITWQMVLPNSSSVLRLG